jgi:putative metallohydrolase (TIGR04338 family)
VPDLSVKGIYATEALVGRILNEVGVVDFYGSTLDLPANGLRQFTPQLLPIMTGMVEGLYLSHRREGTPLKAPTLRASKRAYTTAHYHPGKHEIMLPLQRWAFSELVLLHEIAHAAVGGSHSGQRSAHGKAWRATYAALVRDAVSPEASLILMDALNA